MPEAPTGTYRVQIRPDFDLRAVLDIVRYLASLGVSHLYSSPLLQAVPGSSHGYDVVDHTRVSTELGGEPARRELMAGLRAVGLGLVVDIVPNHFAVGRPEHNRAWWDVLRCGPDSDHAGWFDIDWTSGPLLLPVLDDDPAALHELRFVNGELVYRGRRFPVAAGTGHGTPHQVHERQHYRLVSSRRSGVDLNYRRFFAESHLAGLRIEDPEVFRAVHQEVLRWYAAGDVAGIRVDHPDGMRDPTGYFERLAAAAPDAWLVAEKIPQPGEDLPDWPVAGTTGYDALREVCGLFVDPTAEPAFTALGDTPAGGWREAAYQARREVVTSMLGSELRRLSRLTPEVPDAADALAELLSSFPVYRGYLPYGREYLEQAVTATLNRRPELAAAVARLVPRLEDPDDELALRFQQTSGAVMGKGVEDRAFYRWSRFVALNEVGGDPSRFGVSVEEFHEACARRQRRWPFGMTSLSTHDTKRGEDVRARMAALSELPSRWARLSGRWLGVVPVPDRNFGQLLLQTAVGAWPIEPARLREYAVKAGREAAVWTNWEDPDRAAEAAVSAAIDRIHHDPGLRAEIDRFAAEIRPYGWSNSLGQKLVQLAMPGVPDTYQGCELWDDSLVDPDNRRPVDFASRRALLARLDTGWLPPIDATGAVKLLVTSRVLRLRRERPELFGGYRPVYADGPARCHVVAFDRGGAIAVATRLPVGLRRAGGWRETVLPLPTGEWTDLLTGASYHGVARLAEMLNRYPVALLGPGA
ncbi:MAG TPA: malto-oligosyltrehalose synthase [Micromonosporaceae bacterium]